MMDMIRTRGKGIGRLLLALALLVGLVSQPARATLVGSASAASCAAPAGVTTGGYPRAVLADAPLGYWRLDETCGGTVYDSSGNGLSGQINGGVTTGQPGAPVGDADPAMSFDGSTGYISLGDPAALQPAQVSVEAWINTTVAGGIIVRKRLFGYALALNGSGQPTFTITDAHTAVYDATGSTAVTDGRWHHLVGTYDGSQVCLYVDGAPTVCNLARNLYYQPDLVAIGRDGGASDGYAAGKIDEVAIYGTALSAAQARAHYAAATAADANATATAQAPTVAAQTANANATAGAQAAIVNATASAQAANLNATATAQTGSLNATATAEAGNSGVTLRVCPSGCPYARIQDAVDAAPAGATVQVGAGSYTEKVTIGKSLTLAGAGSSQTVISGTRTTGALAPLVTITGTALGVTLSGLALRGNLGPTGAGLFNNGRPGLETTRLVGVVVVGNSTFFGSGGGIADAGGDLQVISSTISGNTGAGSGGGIALLNGGIALTVVASTVSGNATNSQGGGIISGVSNTVRLLDSTVYDNVAQQGGGVDTAGTLALTASTVYSNTSSSLGGGVFAQNGATVALTDTILAGNKGPQGATGPDCSAALRSGGYNLLGVADTSCSGLVDGQNGDQAGTATAPLDPRLGLLRDNGGPTPTLAPLAGSLANDVVPPASCMGPTDQRGSPRPVPFAVMHGYCTVGAVEYDLTPTTRYVTPAGSDTGDCTASASPCRTIGYGIARAVDGDTVSVGAGIYTETASISETVTISKSLTLTGAGATRTSINGARGAGVAPLITITGTAAQVTLSGLTLQGNKLILGGSGAGLLNAARPALETTWLFNDVVAHNLTAAGQGGGIADVGGNLEVISSTISGNATNSQGGGISTPDNNATAGYTNTVTLIASTVANNVASFGGGGIYGTSQGGGYALRLLNSTVYSNTATNGQGGGIDVGNGSVALTAGAVYSNSANQGGGIVAPLATTLTDTILAGNTVMGTGAAGPDCYGTLTSGGDNLLGDNSACAGLSGGRNGDQAGTAAYPLNPRLGPLADNGGPTLTLALLAGSTAIDAVPAASCIGGADQRGFPRPDGPGLPCDIGAVESSGVAGAGTTAPLPAARAYLAAATGGDGRVYAIGGGNPSAGVTFDTVAAYDPHADSWSAVAPLSTPRDSFAGATGGDGRIYAIGGNGHGTNLPTLNTVEAYSPASATWTAVAPLPGARTGLAAATGHDGRIYAMGGWTGSTGSGAVYNTVEAYDPVSNTWTAVAPLPTARFDLAAVTGPDGRIYAIGGRADTSVTPLTTVEAYNPVSNTWTTLAPLPTARLALAAAVGSDGRIYAIGGYNFADPQASSAVEAYDPRTNTWAAVAPLRTGRFGLAAAAGPDGRIYAIGGIGSGGIVNTVEAYTPAIDAWSRSTVSPGPAPAPTGTSTPVPATATSTAVPTATATTAPPTATSTPLPPTSTPTSTPVPPTGTNTPVPPTATNTNTAGPPTATRTSAVPAPTSASTAVPAPATSTNTPLPATATSTLTNTPVPPTATTKSTVTNTPVPPTATSTVAPPTSTSTVAPPTAINTAVPTATSTSTSTAAPPTSTSTPPTAPTSTGTVVPPTSTSTAVPTATKTLASPTGAPTRTVVPPTSTSVAPPMGTATSTPSPTPTGACAPIYAGIAVDRVPRGGTADILFAAPSGSTIAVTIATGAAYPRRATLLLPTERGGDQVRFLTGTRVATGYHYTFPAGVFFGSGYALLSFPIPRAAPLEAVTVTAAAREQGGCTATATTRFTVVVAGAARGERARSAATWVDRGVAGTPRSAARGVFLPATLSQAGLSLSTAASAAGRPPRGVAAGGTVAAIRDGSLAACRDTVVSSLPVHVTTAARIRVSGTAGYLLGGAGACSPMLYVALRGASHATILATARVTTGVKLDRFALLGGGGALRGTGRGAGRDYVAAPGRYLLQLRLAPRDRGAGSMFALRVTALTYTQDRATAMAGARR